MEDNFFGNLMSMLESSSQIPNVQTPEVKEEESDTFINNLREFDEEEEKQQPEFDVQTKIDEIDNHFNERLKQFDEKISLLNLMDDGKGDDLLSMFYDPSDDEALSEIGYGSGENGLNLAGKVLSNNNKLGNTQGINPNIQPLFNQYNKQFGVGNLGVWGDKSHQKRKSDHNTGDAIDLETGKPRQDIANNLVAEAKQRNIKYIIHDNKIWSQEKANQGWRPYNGENPHKGHIHVSFNK